MFKDRFPVRPALFWKRKMAGEGTIGIAVASGSGGQFFQSAQRLHEHLLTIRPGCLLSPLSRAITVQTRPLSHTSRIMNQAIKYNSEIQSH